MPQKDALWLQVDELATRKRVQDYEAAIQILKDLRDLEFQSHEMADFEFRLGELRSRHQLKKQRLAFEVGFFAALIS